MLIAFAAVLIWLLPFSCNPVVDVKPLLYAVIPPVDGAPDVNVHDSTFWLEDPPPEPPVKPTYAVLLPITVGIFTVHDCENDLFVTASESVIASVVPS